MNPKLSIDEKQQRLLCWIIDEWYLTWESKIVETVPGSNGLGTIHYLGSAKEELKAIICGEKESNEVNVVKVVA